MRTKKNELRRQVLARRDLVSPAEAHAAAEAVARAGMALVQERLAPGATISAYWPMRSEIGTRPLMELLTAKGYRTALPVTHKAGEPLTFRLWTTGDDLAHGRLGIEEPLATAEEAIPDVLYVPLAAFDARGGRIGYGAGHFDATIAALRAQRPTIAVGLGYDLQEIDAVPLEGHDERLDFIITETRTLATGER